MKMSLLGLPESSADLAQKIKEWLILWKFSAEKNFVFGSLFLLTIPPSISHLPLISLHYPQIPHTVLNVQWKSMKERTNIKKENTLELMLKWLLSFRDV